MNIIDRRLMLCGILLGAIAVILGAMGAHALKRVLTQEELLSFETGIRYQMYHAFLLLIIAIVPSLSHKQKRNLLSLIVSGIICFSLSIYLLVIDEAVLGVNFGILGPVTPIGGLLLITAWLYFFYVLYKSPNNS